jgi:hypothetical protein
MCNILGSFALAYLAGSGSVTNSSVVGRGLFRAIRHLIDGDYREAGVETLAASALMNYASTASLVMEVVDGAYSLANPAMEEAEVPRFVQRKAALRAAWSRAIAVQTAIAQDLDFVLAVGMVVEMGIKR